MRILHVVGARPNFMKVAPVMRALRAYSEVEQVLVHTGQHYDANMSRVFFEQLGIPEPDINLNVGSSSHARQTAEIMIQFEPVVLEAKPDLVLVYGDVNSTVATALVSAKLQIPVGHVEAGLRSFDRTMPEEINRLMTDQIADLLFTPSADGDEHLLQEGISKEKIFRVGNVMIDTLVRLLPEAERLDVLSDLSLEPGAYGLVTLHRPSNVDGAEDFSRLLASLIEISREVPLIFPVHPRTRAMLKESDVSALGLRLTDPIGYTEFLALQHRARLVITDSGGIQEETTFLGIPCLTVRENTERPITVELGTNRLVGKDLELLKREVRRILRGEARAGTIPPLWDGRAGQRIAQIVVDWLTHRA